jgi:nucleoside phosphorylase
MMSRFSDILPRGLALTEPSVLPVVDWQLVGNSSPTPVNVTYQGPQAKLPNADIVVLTWTNAEWTALDHVFLRSSTGPQSLTSGLASRWFLYGRGASTSSPTNPLWGYYQLVDVKGSGNTSHRVLLFKSDAHLAHPPWINGLTQALQDILADVSPSHIYSIGTAGGASLQQSLGDVAITNAAKIQLDEQPNLSAGYNGQAFTCTTWFPDTQSLLPQVQAKLFYALDQIAGRAQLEQILNEAKREPRDKSLVPYSIDDFLNACLDPQNLKTPKAVPFQNTPLLTTDYYYIADGDEDFAALEMDDAVIAHVASQQALPFAFVRNISDTLVPSTGSNGQPIDPNARDAWSSVLYEHFGLYTSFNGALATWATIAAS